MLERCGWRRVSAVAGTLCLGGLLAQAGEAEPNGAGRLFEEGIRAIRAVVAEGQQAVEAVADPNAAARKQRQQQIAQQAQQMAQFFQPTLQAELEMVRRSCGSLAADGRRRIVAAGNAAVQATALQFAARQFGERGQARFDGRGSIHDAVAAAVKPLAKADEFAAYEREHAARIARRGRTARIVIVAKLDQNLDLSTAQRAAIEADLEKRWETEWIRELDDTGGMRVNNYPPAPDFADACIAPHLDERQLAEWKQWCRQAGWSRMGHHQGWNFDGQALQPDPWWAP